MKRKKMSENEPYIRPDVKALLDLLAQNNAPKMVEMSLEHARAAYRALHELGDRPSRELTMIRDLPCPGPVGDIPLRLYDKREERSPGPAIVFFHGGGFVIGDLESHNSLCTEIAAQMDLPVIAVDYRRAPEAPFPAAVDDCEAAARWIAASPAEINRQLTGLITMGDSAGGNAAIVVGQQLAAAPAEVPVILQVPIFPSAGDPTETKSIAEFAEGYILTRATIEFFHQSYAPVLDDPRAFPILGDIATSPPSVVVTASLDPIRDVGRDYAAALATNGIDHIFLEMKGVTHSFTNLRRGIAGAQADTEAIFAAMKLMLERCPA